MQVVEVFLVEALALVLERGGWGGGGEGGEEGRGEERSDGGGGWRKNKRWQFFLFCYECFW